MPEKIDYNGVLKKRKFPEALADPKKCALLVIDIQNDFCNIEGKYGKAGVDISYTKRMIPNVKKLINMARNLKLPMVYTRTQQYPQFAKKWSNFRPWATDLCLLGTWGEDILDEIKPLKDDLYFMVPKNRSDGFYQTNLELILREMHIETLIVCGTSSNACVQSTVRAAHMRNFVPVVASDACGTFPSEWKEKFHDGSMEMIQWAFGDVLTTDEIIKELESDAKKS